MAALAEGDKSSPDAAMLLDRDEALRLAMDLPDWTLKDTSLERQFKFRNFVEAVQFVNRIANEAEDLKHHPDIHISYNKVRLELSTHSVGGLSHNDFELAKRIDKQA